MIIHQVILKTEIKLGISAVQNENQLTFETQAPTKVGRTYFFPSCLKPNKKIRHQIYWNSNGSSVIFTGLLYNELPCTTISVVYKSHVLERGLTSALQLTICSAWLRNMIKERGVGCYLFRMSIWFYHELQFKKPAWCL